MPGPWDLAVPPVAPLMCSWLMVGVDLGLLLFFFFEDRFRRWADLVYA